jgi:hypothetical protein
MFNPRYDTLLLRVKQRKKIELVANESLINMGYMYSIMEVYMYIFNRIVPKQVFLSEKRARIKALDQVQAMPKPYGAQKLYI